MLRDDRSGFGRGLRGLRGWTAGIIANLHASYTHAAHPRNPRNPRLTWWLIYENSIRQNLGLPHRRSRDRRAGDSVYRSPSHSRGHDSASLHGPPPPRPESAPSGQDGRNNGSLDSDYEPVARRLRRDRREPGADAGAELQGLRHSSVRSRESEAGHRARDRSGAGRHSARQDDRVRRRSEEHTSELLSPCNLVCRLLLEKKKKKNNKFVIYSIHNKQQIRIKTTHNN